MDYLVIEGARPLHGSVEISGSKNAALPMLMASILSEKVTHFKNLPRLSDVDFALKILIELGGNVRMVRENNLISAYIEFEKQKYKVRTADNIVLGEKNDINKYNAWKFRLHFPAIPSNADYINISEEESSGWKWNGVSVKK